MTILDFKNWERVCPAVVIVFCMSSVCLSAPSMGEINARPTAKELVDLYRKAVTCWDKSVAMRVELVNSWAKRGTDETDIRCWRYDITHRRDSNRCEWFGRCQFKGEWDGNEYSHNSQFKRVVGDDFFLYYTKQDSGQEPEDAFMGSDVEERLLILQAQGNDGGFLLGRMGGIGPAQKMVELMSDGDNLNLIGQETLSDSLCYIVEARTKYGTFTVWIAPEKGYNALKYKARKSGKDILRDDIRIKDQGITEWVEVVDSIDVQKIDGVFVPISGKLTSKARAADDWECADHVEVKRSEIVLDPDFRALGAFEISFPEGTEVTHDDIPGLRFRWTKGRFVPDMNEYLFKNLTGKTLPSFDRITTDFNPSAETGKMILACFFDVNQRPSRHCIVQLARRAEQLKHKSVAVIIIQVSKADRNVLDEWVKKNNVLFPVGMIRGDEEKARFAWGVRSLPWLILTDRKHKVLAEGLGLDQLESKIK